MHCFGVYHLVSIKLFINNNKRIIIIIIIIIIIYVEKNEKGGATWGKETTCKTQT